MLIQINDNPVQFYTSNAADLKEIDVPYTVNTQITTHPKHSHTFLNPTIPTNHTSSAPYTTTLSETSTTTFIATLT